MHVLCTNIEQIIVTAVAAVRRQQERSVIYEKCIVHAIEKPNLFIVYYRLGRYVFDRFFSLVCGVVTFRGKHYEKMICSHR